MMALMVLNHHPTPLTLLWLADSKVAPWPPPPGIHTLCHPLPLSGWDQDMFLTKRIELRLWVVTSLITLYKIITRPARRLSPCRLWGSKQGTEAASSWQPARNGGPPSNRQKGTEFRQQLHELGGRSSEEAQMRTQPWPMPRLHLCKGPSKAVPGFLIDSICVTSNC